MPRVSCFQHIDCEGPGTLWDVLKSKGVQVELLKPFQGEEIPAHPGDGLIVLGGPMGVYEERRFPWMTKELDAIRRCLDSSIPVLGICLGSQMLAHAAGGQVFRGAQPEVGWFPIDLTSEGHGDPLLLGLPGTFDAFHWHGDTFTLPKGAVRLAESALYRHQVFKVGGNAYGFQCHLEVTGAMAREWASLYAKELTPQGGPNRPERILEGLEDKARALRVFSEKVFSRFAALL
ncbi:MAG TPA: type 1 glutamine amidotransferase [bacterium]|nr:type 1 glutamine amidotransferase [bacterium]